MIRTSIRTFISISLLAITLAITSAACTKPNSGNSSAPGPVKVDTSGADKAIADAKNAADDARDVTSGGGQPGLVSISGPLAAEGGVSDLHLWIERIPGRGWRATAPKLEEKSLAKSQELSEDELKEIAKAKELKTIVYVGCELLAGTTSLLSPGDLEPITFKATPSDPVTTIKANTVFICGEAAFPNRMTSIVAEKVYLNGSSFEFTGGPANDLSIITSDLLLSNITNIVTQWPSGSTTVVAGPSISISALRIGDTHGGDGKTTQEDRIRIKAYGADYKEEKPEEPKPDRLNREPSGAVGQDGQIGGTGARGQDGEAGQSFLIASCDDLVKTAVYRTEDMQRWPEDLRDMCSVRSATLAGLAQANSLLDVKIKRLFATGYLRNQEIPTSFGKSRDTEIERLTIKMAFVNELDQKVAAQQTTNFGCHRARMMNRHNEDRSYNVCINGNLISLSREGDVRVDLTLKAYEITADGTIDTAAFISERSRLSALPPSCAANGIPVFEKSSIESNGTQFKQTVTSNCVSYTVDYDGLYPAIKIRFDSP